MQWFAQAPSNIALIKYMGKTDADKNIPANASLSYTLDKLITSVSLESIPGKESRWEPLETPGISTFRLSSHAISRFLAHLEFLKKKMGYQGAFIVRSNNNFPTGSGLASSASSFAALTKVATRALCELTQKESPSQAELASLSRVGSGSSCRSFFSPWCLWDKDTIKEVELPYTKLIHQVIILSHEEKKISSSKAHELVKSSSNYYQRTARAAENLKQLLAALSSKNWVAAFEICWQEFHDMHRLFETAKEPFTYMSEQSKALLHLLQKQWHETGDGPVVTMDAGPNVHLLYRMEQADDAERFKHNHLVGHYDVL